MHDARLGSGTKEREPFSAGLEVCPKQPEALFAQVKPGLMVGALW